MSVYFYDLPTTAKRRNRYVYPSSKAGSLKIFDMPEILEEVGIDRTSIDYLTPRKHFRRISEWLQSAEFILTGEVEFVPLTIWVVGNFDDPTHVDLLREAALAMVCGLYSISNSS